MYLLWKKMFSIGFLYMNIIILGSTLYILSLRLLTLNIVKYHLLLISVHIKLECRLCIFNGRRRFRVF